MKMIQCPSCRRKNFDLVRGYEVGANFSIRDGQIVFTMQDTPCVRVVCKGCERVYMIALKKGKLDSMEALSKVVAAAKKSTNKATKVIENRLAKIIEPTGKEMRVFYSAYETKADDPDDIPVDNLDQVAATGTVVFFAREDGRSFTSKVYENPTWADVALEANNMIHEMGYVDHIFLEAIHLDKAETKKRNKSGDPASYYEFSMGS